MSGNLTGSDISIIDQIANSAATFHPVYGTECCIPTVIKAGQGPPPVWTALPEGTELPAWVYGE